MLRIFTDDDPAARATLAASDQLRLCLSAISLASGLDPHSGPAAVLTHDLLVETALGQIPALVRATNTGKTWGRISDALESWSATESPALCHRLERHGRLDLGDTSLISAPMLAGQYLSCGHGGSLLAGDDLAVVDRLIADAPHADGELGRACRQWRDALPGHLQALGLAIEDGADTPEAALCQRDVGLFLAAVLWDEECRDLNERIHDGIAAARQVVADIARSDEPVVGAADDLLVEALVGFIGQEARAVHLPGVGVFLSRSALEEAAAKTSARVLDRTLVHEILHTIQPAGEGTEDQSDIDWVAEEFLTEAITERLALDLGSLPPPGWREDSSPRDYYGEALTFIDEILARLHAGRGLLVELSMLPDGRRQGWLAERLYGSRTRARQRLTAVMTDLAGGRWSGLSSHETRRALQRRMLRGPRHRPPVGPAHHGANWRHPRRLRS